MKSMGSPGSASGVPACYRVKWGCPAPVAVAADRAVRTIEMSRELILFICGEISMFCIAVTTDAGSVFVAFMNLLYYANQFSALFMTDSNHSFSSLHDDAMDSEKLKRRLTCNGFGV